MQYPNYYGYQTPYYPQQQQNQFAQPQQTGINWVQGEEGAKGFLVAAGSSYTSISKNLSFLRIAFGMEIICPFFFGVSRAAQSTTALTICWSWVDRFA